MAVRGVAWVLACGVAPAAVATWGAGDLPQTNLAYDIEVTLDPATRRLDGRQTIRWRNPSAAPVQTLPLHLYLNGFAHEDTTWMRSVPGSFLDLEALLARHDDPWGWIEPRSIRQDDDVVDLAWHPIAPDDGNVLDRSLISVELARPLAPGGVVELHIRFEARLPIPMARTGGRDDFFMVAQWFPKLAVFETAGTRQAPSDRWNAHQFHGPTEFYAEYADYDVTIGVPPGWNVVSTGRGGPQASPDAGATVRHHYSQRAVHDFAWCASPSMVDVVSTHQPEGGGPEVELHVFVPDGLQHQVPRWRLIAEAGLDLMGTRVGPYPYETLTIITPPHWASATFGMEYPTLFTGYSGDPIWDSGPGAGVQVNEVAIAHEFAHQYFYGVVGTNEFEEAFLDEGMSEYWGNQITFSALGQDRGPVTLFGRGMDPLSFQTLGLDSAPFPQPVLSRPSYLARHSGTFSQYYTVPSVTLATAAALFGQDAVDAVFAGYYRRWAFGHPSFEDFLQAARDFGSAALADLVLEAFSRHSLPDYRVESVRSSPWTKPRGHFTGELSEPDPAAPEADGGVQVQIDDPGWTHGNRRQDGGTLRRSLAPEGAPPDADWEVDDTTLYLSTAKIEGAGWEHLPVEVVFSFADGVRVRDTWDGRAGYRRYRFLRTAPLSEVAVDPAGHIVLDPDRANNALRRQPDNGRTGEWSLWLGSLFQLLLEGVGQWL